MSAELADNAELADKSDLSIASAAQAPRQRWAVSVASLCVLAVGLIATGILSWVSHSVDQHNEKRLLVLQTKQAGAVLQEALPSLQTPLASAAVIAATTNGDAAAFRSYVSGYVGSAGQFVSVSLWRLSGGSAQVVTTVGQPAELAASPGKVEAFLSRASQTSALSVVGVLDATQPRLGYGFPSVGPSPAFAVYAESALPADRRLPVQADSPFASLKILLYLGRSPLPDMLLESTDGRTSTSGRTSTVVVPFGTNALTLVASPAEQLGGTLSASLWWIIAIVGTVMALVAALVAERLVRRRRAAELLTVEVEHLLGEQRTIAESLQRALLPVALPAIAGTDIGVRYLPGVNGVEIGGDWYDVLDLDDRRLFFVIGDVSGRGVAAGSVMASLHFAIRGFVSEGHSPATILNTLSGLLDLRRDGHFATVLCGVLDLPRREMTVANAGHLPPLLVADHGAELLATPLGPPIGVASSTKYESVTFSIPPNATLLLYTDGLVERRRESLDVGLSRLRQVAGTLDEPLEAALSTIVTALVPDGCDDDTAILGVRWRD